MFQRRQHRAHKWFTDGGIEDLNLSRTSDLRIYGSTRALSEAFEEEKQYIFLF
jgi:hypothetical protein